MAYRQNRRRSSAAQQRHGSAVSVPSSLGTGMLASQLAADSSKAGGNRAYAVPLLNHARNRGGGGGSSIATSGVETGGSDYSGYGGYGAPDGGRHRTPPIRNSVRGALHQEAAMLRFPGVPAPRPGPLRRGDLVYLQSLRMALHADMRDAEGLCLRRVALVLCVLLAAGGVWQGVVLLGDSSSGPGGHLPAPRIAEACLQVLVWLTAAALLALEGTKGVHTSVFVRLSWLTVWIGSLVKGYDLVVPRVAGLPAAAATYPGTLSGAAASLPAAIAVQIVLTTATLVVAAVIHCRHIKSELYDLEREATVLFEYDTPGSTKQSTFRRLLVLASVDIVLLVTGVLGSMIAAGANIGFQVMFGKVLQAIVQSQLSGKNELDGKIAIQLVCAFGIFLGNILQMGFIETAGTRLVTRLQRYTFAAIVEQDMGFFDVHKTGELTTILTANTSLVRNGVTTQLALAMKGFVQFVAIFTYLLVTNSSLTGFFMGVAMIPLVVAGLALSCVAKLTKKMTDSQGNQVRMFRCVGGGLVLFVVVVVVVVVVVDVVVVVVVVVVRPPLSLSLSLSLSLFLSLFPHGSRHRAPS